MAAPTYGTIATSGTNSLSVTVPSGCDALLLFVGTEYSGSSVEVTGVSDGTQSATFVADEALGSSSSNRVSLWVITTPTVGTSTWSASYSGSPLSTGMAALPIFGCDTTDPVEVTAGGANGLTSITTSITTLTDDSLLLDLICSGNIARDLTPDAAQTELAEWDGGASNNGCRLAVSTKDVATAGATSMGYSASGSTFRFVHLVVALPPGASGASADVVPAAVTYTAVPMAASLGAVPGVRSASTFYAPTAAQGGSFAGRWDPYPSGTLLDAVSDWPADTADRAYHTTGTGDGSVAKATLSLSFPDLDDATTSEPWIVRVIAALGDGTGALASSTGYTIGLGDATLRTAFIGAVVDDWTRDLSGTVSVTDELTGSWAEYTWALTATQRADVVADSDGVEYPMLDILPSTTAPDVHIYDRAPVVAAATVEVLGAMGATPVPVSVGASWTVAPMTASMVEGPVLVAVAVEQATVPLAGSVGTLGADVGAVGASQVAVPLAGAVADLEVDAVAVGSMQAVAGADADLDTLAGTPVAVASTAGTVPLTGSTSALAADVVAVGSTFGVAVLGVSRAEDADATLAATATDQAVVPLSGAVADQDADAVSVGASFAVAGFDATRAEAGDGLLDAVAASWTVAAMDAALDAVSGAVVPVAVASGTVPQAGSVSALAGALVPVATGDATVAVDASAIVGAAPIVPVASDLVVTTFTATIGDLTATVVAVGHTDHVVACAASGGALAADLVPVASDLAVAVLTGLPGVTALLVPVAYDLVVAPMTGAPVRVADLRLHRLSASLRLLTRASGPEDVPRRLSASSHLVRRLP